jgi:hypothetical protein
MLVLLTYVEGTVAPSIWTVEVSAKPVPVIVAVVAVFIGAPPGESEVIAGTGGSTTFTVTAFEAESENASSTVTLAAAGTESMAAGTEARRMPEVVLPIVVTLKVVANGDPFHKTVLLEVRLEPCTSSSFALPI